LPFPAIHYHTLSGACRDVRTESLPRLLLKQLDSLQAGEARQEVVQLCVRDVGRQIVDIGVR
jgi:hypothetical protein